MSLQTRLSDLITAMGTDYKQLRTWITGSSSGTLSSLNTTDESSLVAAINEVKVTADAAAPTPDASETVKGKAELATLAEVATGTDTTRIVTAAGVRQERTAIEASIPAAVPSASTTVEGKIEIATLAEVTTGTDTARAVTPEGVRQERTAIEAGIPAAVPAASVTVQGKIEIATLAEVTTGTDTARAVTPEGVRQERIALKAEILGAGVPSALDTLDELAAAIGDDASYAASITTALANRVRVDTAAQGLNGTEQSNARTNILAQGSAAIGDPDVDLVALYTTAKA